MKKIVKLIVLVLILVSCDKSQPTASINKKLDNKESFVLYISQTTCSVCTEFTPVLKEVKKNYSVNYFDWVIDEDKSEREDKQSLIARLKLPESLATPTWVIITNGNTVDYEIGYVPYRTLLEFLKEHDIIK